MVNGKMFNCFSRSTGIGKTVILHMLAWCLATGAGFFGKPILIRGNVLIIAAEETINEMNIRFALLRNI